MKKTLQIIILIILSIITEIGINNINLTNSNKKGTIYLDKNIEIQNHEDIEQNGGYKYKYVLKDNNVNSYIDEIEFSIANQESISQINLYNVTEENTKMIRSEKITCCIARKNIYVNSNVKSLIIELYTNDQLELGSFKIINSFNFNFIRFLTILSIFFATFIIYDSYKYHKNLSSIFLKMSLMFGLLFAIATPVYHSWDEQEHFVKAYNLSRGNIIMRQDEFIKWNNNSNSFVISSAYNNRTYKTYNDFVIQYSDLNDKTSGEGENGYFGSTAITYLPTTYVPAALGILAARIFGGSLITQFYLGRVFNTLFYSFMIWLGLKKIKSSKTQLACMALALLPTLLFLSASYSADVMTNTFAMLSFMYTVSILQEKSKFSIKKLSVLIFMCSITTLSKVSYFPIFALPLVIPKSKFESAKSKKWYIAGSILIGIICFAIATLYAGKMGMTQWPIPGVNVADQLRYIVFNPIKYLYIFGKLMIGNLFVLLQGATTNLAYCGILENGLGLLSIILILFTFSINKDLRLTKFQKITFLLISIACLGATATTLYLTFTPVGANSISGFQGRYMLPVLSMLFVGLSGSIESKAKYSKIETGILILILSLIMISALKIIGAYYL